MITLKELEYVTSRANKVPYPGIAYSENAASKMITAVHFYEQYYKDKEYEIILSDGKQFSFEIMPKNVCHMLGIDFKSLSGDYYKDFRSNVLGVDEVRGAYDLLKLLIDNMEAVLKYDFENKGKVFNYYRLMVKCAIFAQLSDFSRFNFGVINFDKQTFLDRTNSNHTSNAEKLLYVQSNEQNCPYFMMGILQDRFSTPNLLGKYVVETLFAPTNPSSYFDDQKVAIPTQILIISNTMDKKEATSKEKLALINQYNAIVSQYNLANSLDIHGDYLAMLSKEENDVRVLRKN